MGVPQRTANDTTRNERPIRLPTLVMSSVRLAIDAGGKLTKVPEKKPKRMANTMIPARSLTASQQRMSTPDMMTHGVSILIGPV